MRIRRRVSWQPCAKGRRTGLVQFAMNHWRQSALAKSTRWARRGSLETSVIHQMKP
jgi:hypothetical protein